MYSDAATEGEDFALAERLFHLRHIHEVGIVGEADATAEMGAAGAAVTADGDEAGAGDGGIVDEALTRTTDQLRGQYVLGLLEANEVDDARAALDRWADDTSTELAWSRALLAYARWRPTVDEDDEDEDEEQESDDDDDDDDGEAAPALVAAADNDDSDAAVGDGGPELEEAAKEALRIATTTNHHIAQIMSSIEQFARVIDPSDLRGARATETAGYPGSIEEALTYMSDSGMMWMERSGLEEWVSEVLADHPNMQAQPRKCMGSKKYGLLLWFHPVEPSSSRLCRRVVDRLPLWRVGFDGCLVRSGVLSSYQCEGRRQCD